MKPAINAFFFYCFIFLSPQLVLAQTDNERTRGFEVAYFTGYHFASNPVIKTGASLNGIPQGIDISWVQYGLKKEAFTESFGKARMALQARIIQMNNVDTFGYCLGILPSYFVPLLNKQKFQIGMKLSYGFNFNSKQYHEQKNFDNRAISSGVNFAFDWGIHSQIQLKENLQLTLGTGLYHVSNGSLKMPNGGINIIYGNVGLSYFPHGKNGILIQKPNYQISQKKLHYMLNIAGAYRELGYFNYITKFPVFTISNNAYLSLNKLYGIGLGLDAFYDATQVLLYASKLRISDVAENQKYFLAIGLYNRMELGKLFFPLGIYHYLTPMKYVKEPIYVRFGLGYQITKHLYSGLFFKGTINKKQQLQSDFMEWSLGFNL